MRGLHTNNVNIVIAFSCSLKGSGTIPDQSAKSLSVISHELIKWGYKLKVFRDLLQKLVWLIS